MPHTLAPQDALLFLKDYFTSLAAGINPMVPAETSAEGERLDLVGEGPGLLCHASLGPPPVCLACSAPRDPSPGEQPPGRGARGRGDQRHPGGRRWWPRRFLRAAAHLLPVRPGLGLGGLHPARSATKGPLLLIPREFRFTSEVPIWLDYHGKHMSMDQVVSGAVGRHG